MAKLNSMGMESTQRSQKINDLAIFPSPGRQIQIVNNSVHVPNHLIQSKQEKSELGGDLSQMGNYLGQKCLDTMRTGETNLI